MNIWKLGTKWGSNAPSFYEYIQQKSIILSHTAHANPQEGDYMLITDGFTVLAIATLLQDPAPVWEHKKLRDDLWEYEIEVYDHDDTVIYAPAQYRILSTAEVFSYPIRKGIVQVRDQAIIEQVLSILPPPTQQQHEQDTGIEEDAAELDLLEDPFNPEDISINSKRIAMETCLRRLSQGTIILNPDFQRKEVWTITKKSQLMESLMLKIPLPMFYVSADEKDIFTVVDGLQRLSTIRDFILGKEYLATKDPALKGKGFELENLEFWKDYEGKTFLDLPIFIQNRILEAEFSFTIINPGTPEEVKRNIFKRINTGGMPLSSQEIRNALYSGQSTQLLNKLAGSSIFKKATDYSIKDNRMADKELILRFLAFLVRDYRSYTKTISVDSFLSDTMIILNAIPDFNTRDLQKAIQHKNIVVADIKQKSLEWIKQLFETGMERAHQLFGKHAFRKSYIHKRRTPINKSLFEMWGVLLCQLQEEEFEQLKKNKTRMMQSYIPILEDIDFKDDLSRHSMKHSSVKKRFEKISNLINTYINDY
ncbi:MAG: DUF262 domain-containing protein [Aureispira sp.]